MIAAIDSGNSSVKLGIFREGILENKTNSVTIPELPLILKNYPVKKIIISDTGGNKQAISNVLSSEKNILFVSHTLRLPFKIGYNNPGSLGSDRIAAIAGAWKRYSNSDILVIDAGTCITYNFIDKGGNYLGGGISPGINMRLKALKSFTANLPEVKESLSYNLIGSDTRSSILSGTLGGIVSEIKGTIREYRELYSDLIVILCGGSSGFFESKIKDPIFVIPDLVLWGLCVISENNEI